MSHFTRRQRIGMTLDQAAAYLHLPEAQLLALIEAGEIKARKIGSEYRMIRQALDRWLAQQN
jgi:excisionase family DNA binding protein